MEKRFNQVLGFIYRRFIEGIIMYFLFDVSGLITYISETNYSDIYEMKRDLFQISSDNNNINLSDDEKVFCWITKQLQFFVDIIIYFTHKH